MPSLYFSPLLFEYLSIVQENVRKIGEEYSDTKEKVKKNFCLYIVDLGTIMDFFG